MWPVNHRTVAWRTSFLAAAFTWTFLTFALAEDERSDDARPVDSARRQQIEGWIAQLDADAYDDRESASRRLLDAGEVVIPFLESVARHPSPEVRFRAQSVLRTLAQGPLLRLREEMETFSTSPEERLDVEQGMCLIARLMDRSVVEKDLMRQLDELAAKVTEHLADEGDPAKLDPAKAVAALQQVLYKDHAFRGNVEDYANPANGSLAFVLKERKGKPILLAEITVAVARRAKIPIVGVPTGGRYIAKYDGAQAPAGFPRDDIFLDPFGGGVILSRDDRLRLFPTLDPDHLVPPATKRDTIARILRNITADYQSPRAPADPDGQELVQRMLKLLEAPAAIP